MSAPEQPNLRRVLGLSTGILLVASSMIGSGVFKKVAPMGHEMQNANDVLLAWLLAGVVSMFGAFAFAGLAKMTEEAGGKYEYLRLIYGRFFSFLYGWTYFSVIGSASAAAISYVFAESVNNIFPLPHFLQPWEHINIGGFIYPFANSGVKAFAVLTILVLSWVNIRGVKKGGVLNDVTSAMKILGILLLIALGLSYAGGPSAFDSPGPAAADLTGLGWYSALFAAMLGAFWAYDGWINITFMSSEFRDPRRNVPIAIVTGTVLVMLLYLAVNFAFLRILTISDLDAIQAAGNQIAGAEAARRVMGDPGYFLISVLIMLCTFGAANATIMTAARVYFRMSQEGMFFKRASEVHGKYHTPAVSLRIAMVWSSILVVSGTFDQLTDMLIFAAFIFYGAGAMGLIREKWRGRIPGKVIGYPWMPAIFVLFCMALVSNTLYVYTRESLTGLGLILLGLPFYFYFQRERKRG
ncbi:MAG: amino acid permease [Saprospiraceae bacterium]|nr:amino acid permease [Saprospiraceae bacterium]